MIHPKPLKGLKSGLREHLHLIGRGLGDGTNFKSPSGDLGVVVGDGTNYKSPSVDGDLGVVVGDGTNYKSPSADGDLGVDLRDDTNHLIKPIDKQK